MPVDQDDMDEVATKLNRQLKLKGVPAATAGATIHPTVLAGSNTESDALHEAHQGIPHRHYCAYFLRSSLCAHS